MGGMTESFPPDGPSAAPPILAYSTPVGLEPGVWHFGKYVIVSHEADLPDRCVKCNGDTHNQIVWNVGRWRGPLHIGLCHSHARAWRFWRTIGVTSFVLGVLALAIFGAMLEDPATQAKLNTSFEFINFAWPFVLAIGVLFLPALIIDRIAKPFGHMKRKGDTVWIWRSGPSFRNSLRPMDSPPDSSKTAET
jgi:hypothetical protein